MSRQGYVVGQGLGQAKTHVIPCSCFVSGRNAFLSLHVIVYKK